jgi:hypothetical protein
MFPVYGGKCLSRKAFQNWVEKFSRGRSKFANHARPSWLRQQSKDFYATSFDALVKRWDKCISVGGYVNKINVFFLQDQISQFLRYISICDQFIVSSSYFSVRCEEAIFFLYYINYIRQILFHPAFKSRISKLQLLFRNY